MKVTAAAAAAFVRLFEACLGNKKKKTEKT